MLAELTDVDSVRKGSFRSSLLDSLTGTATNRWSVRVWITGVYRLLDRRRWERGSYRDIWNSCPLFSGPRRQKVKYYIKTFDGLKDFSIANPQQVFPLAIVALESHAHRDSKARNDASLDLLACCRNGRKVCASDPG